MSVAQAREHACRACCFCHACACPSDAVDVAPYPKDAQHISCPISTLPFRAAASAVARTAAVLSSLFPVCFCGKIPAFTFPPDHSLPHTALITPFFLFVSKRACANVWVAGAVRGIPGSPSLVYRFSGAHRRRLDMRNLYVLPV